jgi:hypothetical protein
VKKCPICKIEIIDKKHPDRIFCSSGCQHKSQNKSIVVKCDICNIKIERSPSQIKTNNFCSTRCHGIFKIGKPAYNKGTNITNSGSFKKGHKFLGDLSKSNFFKKGDISYWKGKKRPEVSRENNPNWKGGITRYVLGYIGILLPEHPFCDKKGYVLEHRLVMEKHLGRYLSLEEVVHHINGIKSDNRIENLMLFPNSSAHAGFHCSFKQYP